LQQTNFMEGNYLLASIIQLSISNCYYNFYVFCYKNKLLSKNQFGFRPGKSTTGALYTTITFLYKELDQNKTNNSSLHRFGESFRHS